MRYLIGIDEAGRGALAGPVSVGAVLIPTDFDWESVYSLITLRGAVRLRDSKQLSPQKRSILFEHMREHSAIRWAAGAMPAEYVDSHGIVAAIQESLNSAIAALDADSSNTQVLLDAGLRAPDIWQQEAFVKGDTKFPAIALASIVAKVTRDRYMEKSAEEYADYGFEVHKGYGTAIHQQAIRRFGLCPLHRRTFVKTGALSGS
jgi:ribonuclease HII